MSNIPTPHISAGSSEIAETVLMPGDPLRAKYIADNFLKSVHCFNSVRNMLGFTGEYNGKSLSVMGGGMGMPSIGIYSYELFNFYGVKNIIRIGTAGAIDNTVKLRDIVIAMGACTDSNYARQYGLPGTFAPIASFDLLKSASDCANKLGLSSRVGNVLSTDIFYGDDPNILNRWAKMGVLAVEMEAAALYMNAARAGRSALAILTVSDCPLKGESLSSEQRQNSFTDMMKVALEIV